MLGKSFPTGQGLQVERLNALEGAFGLCHVQLYIYALSYHADLLGHQPAPLKANPALRAAL